MFLWLVHAHNHIYIDIFADIPFGASVTALAPLLMPLFLICHHAMASRWASVWVIASWLPDSLAGWLINWLTCDVGQRLNVIGVLLTQECVYIPYICTDAFVCVYMCICVVFRQRYICTGFWLISKATNFIIDLFFTFLLFLYYT